MTIQLELPSDGVITRATFDALPSPARGWAWELHDTGCDRLGILAGGGFA